MGNSSEVMTSILVFFACLTIEMKRRHFVRTKRHDNDMLS